MGEEQVVLGCRLLRLLGAGAMGEVHLARPVSAGLPDLVVVKLLAPGAATPALLARFRRETEVLLRLRPHPHLVRGLAAQVDGPRPALVIEYVEGETLLARLRRAGPLAPDDAAAVGRDVARGLEALHAHGVVHRDVKPENIMITPAGQVKVVDLGLVKDAFASVLTAPEELLGTGPYIPPERWSGDEAEVGPAGDVYALGATLFHLLAGRPPYVGASLEALAAVVASGERPSLRELAPAASEGLRRVVERCLDPDPGGRPRSARAVADDLERVLHGEAPAGPALVRQDGQRVALDEVRRTVLGAGPACVPRLEGPGVAPQHAQLRRVGEGFELRDLRTPGGTTVGGARLDGATLLRDGDVVQLGGAPPLRFDDPSARAGAPAVLRDVTRVAVPALVVEALARVGDPRATLAQLEASRPDPAGRAEAGAVGRALGGPSLEAAALEAWDRAAAARAAAAATWLGASLGLAPGEAGARLDALAAWEARRADAPPQLGPPARALLLRVEAGQSAGLEVPLGEAGLLLVGRDPRCHVRLADRSVSRHHATLLRLHARWAIRDEGRAVALKVDGRPAGLTLLDPGATVVLGDARLALAATPAAPAGGVWSVSQATFEALAASGSSAARPQLEAYAARPTPTAAELLALGGPRDGPARDLLHALAAERAASARRALSRLAASGERTSAAVLALEPAGVALQAPPPEPEARSSVATAGGSPCL